MSDGKTGASFFELRVKENGELLRTGTRLSREKIELPLTRKCDQFTKAIGASKVSWKRKIEMSKFN